MFKPEVAILKLKSGVENDHTIIGTTLVTPLVAYARSLVDIRNRRQVCLIRECFVISRQEFAREGESFFGISPLQATATCSPPLVTSRAMSLASSTWTLVS